jgi:hypothetical protein
LALLGAAILAAVVVRGVSGAWLGDFSAYYTGAAALASGDRLYAGALAWRDAGFAVNFPGPAPSAGNPYAYAPAFALTLIPLTAVQFQPASLIWYALIVVSVVGIAYTLARLLLPGDTRRVVMTAMGIGGLLALFQPVRSILFTGQIDTMLLLLLTLTLAAFTLRKDMLAAVLLALAITIKPTLGVFVLYFLWKRAYRAAFVCCAVAGTLLIAPFLILGLDALSDFLAVLQYWTSPAFGASPVNQSPAGLFLRVFTPNAWTVPFVDAPQLVTLGRVLVAGVTLLTLMTLVPRARATTPTQSALEFGLVVVAMLLAGPVSQDNHYVFLVIPMVSLAAVLPTHWRSSSRSVVALGIALVAVYVYLSLPTLLALDYANYAYHVAPVTGSTVLLTGMHVYGLTVLAVLGVIIARMHRSRHAA